MKKNYIKPKDTILSHRGHRGHGGGLAGANFQVFYFYQILENSSNVCISALKYALSFVGVVWYIVL